MHVPFVSLDRQYRQLRNELIKAFDDVGHSGVYVLGDKVREFERLCAAYCGTRYALAVANGTDALFLVMKALEIGDGNEVITAPNSFISTAGAIAAAGARPRFVDVAPDLNIDVRQIEAAITDRTRALLPVHLTGRPARMDEINAIAARHGLAVIEDAAQAIGARYKGRRVGSLGTAGCFSLHPLKNLHVYGDGGLITTDQQDLYERLVILRNHGLRSRDECGMWGYNSRLDSLQAALGLVKLKHLDVWTARFRDIARVYRAGLAGVVGVPEEAEEEECVYHNFVICVPDRPALMGYLLKRGVETKIRYPIPIHLQSPARSMGHQEGDFPVTESLSRQILCLPIYPELSDDEVNHVVECIRGYYGRLRATHAI